MWITAISEQAYNDTEIDYVINALKGKKNYILHYSGFINLETVQCSEPEEHLLQIAQRYIHNYESNTYYSFDITLNSHVYPYKECHLNREDVSFLISVKGCNMSRREEFGNPTVFDNFFINDIFTMLITAVHPAKIKKD